VIAIVDWGSSASLKENMRFFQRAAAEGRVRPREWRADAINYRSLTLWGDGTCELQRFSTTAVARRLGCSIVRTAARKVRMSQRG
jgi:hypothetical protein